MPTIISYKKYIDPLITRTLILPADASHHSLGAELATLADGLTYVSLPDGAALPATQPPEIAASIINPVTLTPAQIAEIKAASPQVRFINSLVTQRIAEKYTTTDEIGIIRVGAADTKYAAYMAHIDSCRAWGRAEKVKLGL